MHVPYACALTAGILLLAAAALPLAAPRPAQPERPALVDSQRFLATHAPAPARPDHAGEVRALLARMTLREKIGQMTQLEIGQVADGKDAELRLNPAKLRKAVVDYGVGSILNVKDQAMPLGWWRDTLRQIQAAAAQSRHKIPVLYGIDSIHGANYVAGATLFPQPLGMAATWNPEAMLAASRITAAETRGAGIPWNFSPVLDVGRQPLWPRLYETFGEDVYLATVMGIASVRGYQGPDPAGPGQVASCLKHYVGYSLPSNGRDRAPALIPEPVLREYFLPTFAAAVKAGALSVMVNSGQVNGVPGHLNAWLLKDVLRGELGFDGVVVSDWEDIKKLVSVHGAASNEKEATRKAVLAGVDMSMVPSDYSFADLLAQLVEEGAVPMSRIDEAAGRVLTMKMRLGLFEDPLRGTAADRAPGAPAGRDSARQAARESLVLLKNDGATLPLSAGSRVLVTGPTADSMVSLNNGWSLVWQGNRPELYPADPPTLLGALRARLGPERVVHVPGSAYDQALDIAAATTAAATADVVILCLGEGSYAETPGNIEDLALPEAQLRLAEALLAAGKPVVLVLIEGRPRLLRGIAERAAAVLLALNPGSEGGQALADVLLGDVNPSGRLPITYPRHPQGLLTYDHAGFEDQGGANGQTVIPPQWPFGFGLSYTTFAYSALGVTPQTVRTGEELAVAVTVTNTGTRAGAEVVQLYVSDHVASVTPPPKRLRGFAKLTLQAGESRTLGFRLTPDDLAFVGRDLKPVTEPGAFSVRVGSLRQDFSLR